MAGRCSLVPAGLLALLTLSNMAAAFTPLERRLHQRPWTPARETSTSELYNHAAFNGQPEPTAIPTPRRSGRFGSMELLRGRDVSFEMGTDTCGFIDGFSSAPVTCVRQNAYCTNDGIGHLDCCTGAYDECLPSMYTECIGYSESKDGACSSTGSGTVCCWEESPSCYSLIFSTTATPGTSFTLLQCQTFDGTEILLATPPAATRTTSTTSTSSTPTSPSSPTSPTAPPTSTPSSSPETPVGAIVGGAVGGVAVIALVIFAAAFMIQRSRRRGYAPPPAQPPPPGPTTAGVAAAPGVVSYSPQPQPYVGAAGLYDGKQEQAYYVPGSGYVSPPVPAAASVSPGAQPGLGIGYGVPPQGQGQGQVPAHQYQHQHVPGVEDYRAQGAVPMAHPQHPQHQQVPVQGQQGQVYVTELAAEVGVGHQGNPAQLG